MIYCTRICMNVWMRTYLASVHTTSCGSTNLGASDGTAKNTSTLRVYGDCEVSMCKVHTNGAAAWEI
jgi:hypothetical protein